MSNEKYTKEQLEEMLRSNDWEQNKFAEELALDYRDSTAIDAWSEF